MTENKPVFYDCEASSLDGYPIEVGWASASTQNDAILSEGHLIRPPQEWPINESWDEQAEGIHGITLYQVQREGRPAWEIAKRMNAALAGRELFSDAAQDETWLRLLFDAAGIDPTFTIRRTDATVLISRAAAERGMSEAAYERAKGMAAELAPRRHRAEADARHLAVLWRLVAAEVLPGTR
jgi:DNA polymerase III epsilon subunit-like protein